MRSLGKLIVVPVLLLLLTGLIGCDRAEQAVEKAGETIDSVNRQHGSI